MITKYHLLINKDYKKPYINKCIYITINIGVNTNKTFYVTAIYECVPGYDNDNSPIQLLIIHGLLVSEFIATMFTPFAITHIDTRHDVSVYRCFFFKCNCTYLFNICLSSSTQIYCDTIMPNQSYYIKCMHAFLLF